MNQQEIRTYVEGYFKAFQSPFIEESSAHFTVQLPIEVDKDLGNRPFYWTYVEKIGMEPTPLHLTFVFNREEAPDIRGEDLVFGSRRLHQIFQSAQKHGRFVRLYELSPQGTSLGSLSSVPLVPWLGINYKVEFICDQKRDLIFSLGVNLISGAIVQSFYQSVTQLELTPKLPDYSFTMQPIFGLESAADRLENFIQSCLDQEDTTWASQANERLEEEKLLVESFYNEERRSTPSSEDPEAAEEQKQKLAEEKTMRLKELEWQFQPRIEVSTINAGLFYLRTPLDR
ncbi:YqhG family protein [Ammoniphilus sp. YIM 78166]|uniref:YqhG family protein n=1 Tax=Ammoniphilus sp. YIM 78166 TaxID=1644106 RepID=UPI0010700E5C|nr:YqhG family protein [Ammoniphilus sp. YIM 78166]